MLVLATVVFMIGVIAERSMAGESSETRPSQTVTASSSEQSEKAAEGADSHDEGEAAEGTGEEGHTDVVTEPHTEAMRPARRSSGSMRSRRGWSPRR